MVQTSLGRWSSARTIIDAATVPTPIPGESTDIYTSPDSDVVMFVSGTASGTVQLWVYDGSTWYKGDTHDFTASNNPEAVHWSVPHRQFTFQVTAVTGGGNVTIKAL